MNYIGLDCHITTMDFAVVDDAGKTGKASRIETSAGKFLEFVRGVKPPRVIYMEEGTLASWMLETCVRNGEKLVITDPKENRWIGSSGQKNDKLDALKLAMLARGGYVKEIHHSVGQRRQFRELMLAYHDTVRSGVRIKNKIKAKFRQHGIQCTGDTVYTKTHRGEWRGKLPEEPNLLLVIDGLWQQMDQFEETGKRILLAAKAQSRQYPEIKLFKALPGIDFINAATISAILETPWRFADKRKVWMYTGLGVMRKASGEKVYSERLTRDYNRLLKYTIKQAAEAAIRTKDNPFRRKYLGMTLLQGIAPHRAKLTVARDMLAVMLAMWKKGEKFDPELREKISNKQGWA